MCRVCIVVTIQNVYKGRYITIIMVINTEYLAISVIFLGGMYFGFKLKQGLYNIAGYYQSRRNP